MNRRNFVKIGAAFGAVSLLQKHVQVGRAGPKEAETVGNITYKIGERIATEAFVVDGNLRRRHVMDLVQQNTTAVVNVLYIFGGGALENEDRLGGIWCPDSFEDLQILRYVHRKYEFSEVQIIPVACAPVYSSEYYGLERRVFLDEPDESEKFQAAVESFVKSTGKAVDGGYIPLRPYLDLRFRLLFNSSKAWAPAKGYGEIADWQGRFRAEGETQRYGVPTIWMLDSEGVVLEGPFHGNVYHSEPYEINYTVLDIDQAIQKHL